MTKSNTINGVDRCIHTIVNALSKEYYYLVTWIRFTYNLVSETQVQQRNGYRLILVPLPQDFITFLRDDSVRKDFWLSVYNHLSQIFIPNTIIHLHTLNLMEFGILVRQQIPSCKIVTHLHCIPWKSSYNTNIRGFNRLYEQYYLRQETCNPRQYIVQDYEWNAYTKSDCIICVTNCARDFIRRMCPSATPKIFVVPNGIQDYMKPRMHGKKKKNIRCIFVGNPHQSKGLAFVLEAMQTILIRYPASLTVVGNIEKKDEILQRYPFLEIQFVGQLSPDQLCKHYGKSDIGIIASIQEQCSYVAIEMMMSGLPVITTDVDGLGEIFNHGVNGMKVPVSYIPGIGLQVDVLQMGEYIMELGKNPEQRKLLGENARRHYLLRYTQIDMMTEIKNIYSTLFV